jgi:hypothetical protein
MVGGSFKVELQEPPMAVDCEIDHVNSPRPSTFS